MVGGQIMVSFDRDLHCCDKLPWHKQAFQPQVTSYQSPSQARRWFHITMRVRISDFKEYTHKIFLLKDIQSLYGFDESYVCMILSIVMRSSSGDPIAACF